MAASQTQMGSSITDPNDRWWEPLPGSTEEAANKAFEAFSHAQFKECQK
jgi:hypothetical protein